MIQMEQVAGEPQHRSHKIPENILTRKGVQGKGLLITKAQELIVMCALKVIY